jgi:predicted secreted protein
MFTDNKRKSVHPANYYKDDIIIKQVYVFLKDFFKCRGLKKLSEEFVIILNDEDQGRTVEVKAQSLLTVRLKENPTTGYRWKVETAGGLEMAGDGFERVGDAIGAGGVHVFQFRASEAGSHKLSIRNWRDWEGESSIIDRFYATIVVK